MRYGPFVRDPVSQPNHRLWPALVALWSVGCVVPMPIDAAPDEVNLPPFYSTAAVNPPAERIIEFDPEVESELELRTGVIDDPNPEDRIFWRWFFNYQRNSFNFAAGLGPAEGAPPDQKPEGLIIPVVPCADLTVGASSDENIHRIELIVADGPFLQSTENALNPNQDVADGAEYIKLVWFVRFDRSKCP